MNNRDVEQLFELVEVGDAVELLAERTPEADRIFGPVAFRVIGPPPPAPVIAARNATVTPLESGPGNEW